MGREIRVVPVIVSRDSCPTYSYGHGERVTENGHAYVQELRIKNFAIIEELNLSFSKGLNILTGETGAGKSIILNAVQLLLGDKATEELIRSSEEEASVEALFDISANREVKEKIKERGQKLLSGGEEDSLLVRRVILRSGRGKGIRQWESGHPRNAFGDRRRTAQHLWTA